MKRLGAIVQGIVLGGLLFVTCYRIALVQNPLSTKDNTTKTRVFTYQFY